MKLRIKELLKEKNIFVNELVIMINSSPQNLSRLINGHAKPSLATYEKIAATLNIKLRDLFTESLPKEPLPVKKELDFLIHYKDDLMENVYKAEKMLEQLEKIMGEIKGKHIEKIVQEIKEKEITR